MALKLITAPTSEPIGKQEAKLHLRIITDVSDVTPHPEDSLVEALIVAARQGAEHLTGRSLMPTTWELALDGFYEDADCDLARYGRHAYRISLPRPPLASVTSVKYIDANGVLQTMATSDYQLDNHSEPARLMPAYGTCWPSTRCQPNAVRIEYVAGYANATAVPQQIKQWMLLQIGTMYASRESVVSGVSVAPLPFADCLLDAYKIWGA